MTYFHQQKQFCSRKQLANKRDWWNLLAVCNVFILHHILHLRYLEYEIGSSHSGIDEESELNMILCLFANSYRQFRGVCLLLQHPADGDNMLQQPDFMIALSPRSKKKKKKGGGERKPPPPRMKGQFYQDLQRPSADKEKSLVWLCRSGLKGKMESLIIAARDQALNTRYLQRNIMQQPIDSKYRMCLL